jgi:hypothetical protein
MDLPAVPGGSVTVTTTDTYSIRGDGSSTTRVGDARPDPVAANRRIDPDRHQPFSERSCSAVGTSGPVRSAGRRPSFGVPTGHDSLRWLTSIARCRELPGEDAESMTDQDIEDIRPHAETGAVIVIDGPDRRSDPLEIACTLA